MTKPGRMSIRHKVWDIKSTRDFLRLFVKLREEKNELCLLKNKTNEEK